MDVTLPVNTSGSAAASNPAMQSQQQGERNRTPVDAKQLKEEKIAQEAGREFQNKSSTAPVGSAAIGTDLTSTSESGVTEAAGQARRQAEWSRSGSTPNWSSLSAQTQGYTVTERAINLYRHISAIPV